MHWLTHGKILLLLLLLLPGAAAGEVPEDFEGVERALSRSPALLRHHRGYLGFLGRNPELRRVEHAYWRSLAENPSFAHDAHAVEAALLQHEDARAAFDAFYDQLAADGNLLRALESFQRAAQSLAGGLSAAGGLAANPLQWLSILGAPGQEAGAPEALMERITGAPGLAGALRDNLHTLADNGAVVGWWSRLSMLDAQSGGAYGRLAAHFLGDAQAFAAWHVRQLGLAGFPAERIWLRWWHVRAGAVGETGEGGYPAYAAALLETPARTEEAEGRWRAAYGPPLPWPPRTAPPLARIPRDGADVSPRIQGPASGGPASVAMPAMPAMPTRPAMPARPARPPKPLKPMP